MDDQTAQQLQALAQRAGSRNAAIIAAIHVAYREQVLEWLREEARALRDDPAYQDEVRAARADMGAGDAW